MTEQEAKKFEEASKPMMEWLGENCHPHMSVVITTTSSELLEGQRMFRSYQFLKD